jgi:hypothetical protein
MPDSPTEWILIGFILVLTYQAREEWVRGDKRAVPLMIAVVAVILFARSDTFAQLPTAAKYVFFFLLMVFSIDQFNRAFGPRAHGHSRWAIRWGRRDVPKVTRALWFLRLGRLARLTTPVVMLATVMASLQWLQGESGVFLGLSTPDWLTLLGVDMGLWLAALPHGRLRVAPLTNWATMLFGLSCIVASVLFLVQQYVVRAFPTLVDTQVWKDMAHWAQENPPGSVNGWALTVFGVGLALVSLAETTRKWRPSDVIPDPGAPAREARVGPPSQSPMPRGQQKPPKQEKRKNRRKRR